MLTSVAISTGQHAVSASCGHKSHIQVVVLPPSDCLCVCEKEMFHISLYSRVEANKSFSERRAKQHLSQRI